MCSLPSLQWAALPPSATIFRLHKYQTDSLASVLYTAFIYQVLCPQQRICDDAHIAMEANMTGKAHVDKSCESAVGLTAMSGWHRWSDRKNLLFTK